MPRWPAGPGVHGNHPNPIRPTQPWVILYGAGFLVNRRSQVTPCVLFSPRYDPEPGANAGYLVAGLPPCTTRKQRSRQSIVSVRGP